ncbi:hypothetical protein IMZ08_00220 [Bacillus luteolus]|uniref:Uncharacterized protein n=1 Tax=Litchfieldia luteola TaxID=682179 RepID=A0ABR9QE19_9BACI|nr:hypothetical protein [Cytobacillus luteolus]MBE4906479.1 hypothetical protein [Cytobacillus luteolus]MBP1941162.1 septal ring factor EnvC (AmiA/AmiB activator) [Cytobacillus luteolus]
MEQTLQLILNDLKELKEGQQELKKGYRGLQEVQLELKEGQRGLQEVQLELKEGQRGLQEVQLELKEGQRGLQEVQLELKEGQQGLQGDVSSIKDNLINGLGPYFEHIEKHIDERTGELKDTLEDQQRIIDTLAARSVKHESEIKDLKHLLKNQ